MVTSIRTVVMTYNLWGDNRWPERADALRALFTRRPPDILAVQELRPDTRDLLDDVLPHHRRVDDDFPGWHREGNLWWDTRMFEAQDYGTEDIGLVDELSPGEIDELGDYRRLFWVRLRPLAFANGPNLFVSTAHYTFPGSDLELNERINPRIRQTRKTVETLERIAPNEPCLFMGDLNEHWHVLRILRAAGIYDSFGALGMVPPPTWPTVPTWPEDSWTPWVIDFQVHKGPVRPLTTEVVEFFHKELAPSDHKPVVTTYALDADPA
jgi:endonuclease/exonuclease/phosphatase family metal-dependent hydrolase